MTPKEYFEYVVAKTENEHFKDPGVQQFIRYAIARNIKTTKDLESVESERDQIFAECMRLRSKLVSGVNGK